METLHVIKNKKQWAIRNNDMDKAIKLFKYREIAFMEACKLGEVIYVHKEDGTILFKYEL